MKYEDTMKEIAIQHHGFYNRHGEQPNAVMINHSFLEQLEAYCRLTVFASPTGYITQVMGMQIYEVYDNEEPRIIKVCLI